MARNCADQVRAAAAEAVPAARWLVEEVGYLYIVQRDVDWMRQAEDDIEHALA
jgi:hypothetical protein